MRPGAWRIACTADDLEEGLFGQVLLWTFELLPYLDSRGLKPQWDIRSRLYGLAPDYRVLPGVFDLAYVPPAKARRQRSLLALRTRHVSVLGNDWQGLHQLWHRYFQVPSRLVAAADAAGLPPNTLGLHYRGTDKNLASLDTNPVSADDFLTLARDAARSHPEWQAVFVATDEPGFIDKLPHYLPHLKVFHLGPVAFHKAGGNVPGKADRAVLDCVLLSRCATVLKCSSALSGFAKVLNPDLACFRVAACKMFSDVPYFPDAYIPRLTSEDPACQALLQRLFDGDWLDGPAGPEGTAAIRQTFVSAPRYGWRAQAVNVLKYAVSLGLGRPRKA
jgi:hypothetical protein